MDQRPDLLDRLTDRARGILALARRPAEEGNHEEITPEDLLLGMACAGDGVAFCLLAKFGISQQDIRRRLEEQYELSDRRAARKSIPLSAQAFQTLELAAAMAAANGEEYVQTHYLLCAIAEQVGTLAGRVLADLGVTPELIRAEGAKLLAAATPDYRPANHELSADELIGARRIALPNRLREINDGLAEVRRCKEAAVNSEDFDGAAFARTRETQLLREKEALLTEWAEGVDITEIADELDRIYQQAERVRGMLGKPG